MLPESFTVFDVLMDPGPAPIMLRHRLLQTGIENAKTAHGEWPLLRVIEGQQKPEQMARLVAIAIWAALTSSLSHGTPRGLRFIWWRSMAHATAPP